MKLFKRLFCKHAKQTFVRNIFGDEIIAYGWKRSVWKCEGCGKYVYHDSLKYGVDGAPPAPPQTGNAGEAVKGGEA